MLSGLHRRRPAETGNQREGFTLVEVIFALLIFALFAGVLSATVVAALNARAITREDPSREEDVRHLLRMVRTIADEETLEQGGEVETLHSGLVRWEAEYEPTETVDLFDVRVTLDFEDAEGGPITRVETLRLLRPFLSDEAERDSLLQEKKSGLETLRATGGL